MSFPSFNIYFFVPTFNDCIPCLFFCFDCFLNLCWNLFITDFFGIQVEPSGSRKTGSENPARFVFFNLSEREPELESPENREWNQNQNRLASKTCNNNQSRLQPCLPHLLVIGDSPPLSFRSNLFLIMQWLIDDMQKNSL